jgi:hypothetical protein
MSLIELDICSLQSVVNFEVDVPEHVEQHNISLEDDDDANLLEHLEHAVEFVDDAIGSDGKVCACLELWTIGGMLLRILSE